MMDGAAAFLHRHERRALAKARKGEPWRVIVPVLADGATGLLAVSPTRLLHARRGRLRTKVRAWRRRETGIRFEAKGHGSMLLTARAGTRLRFAFVDGGDRRAMERELLPAARPGLRAMVIAPSQSHADPLAHRGTPAHRERLRQLHAQGVLSKAELQWQLGA